MESQSYAALLALVMLPLAGCVMNGGTETGALPDPSKLEVPTWEVGQEWHYKGSDGRWYNWTVVEQETKEGFETYRVRINLSRPDSSGGARYERYVRWYHIGTLGVVAEKKAGLYSNSSPPSPRLFPMRDAEYTARHAARYPHSSEPSTWSSNISQNVSEWTQVSVPAGQVQVVPIDVTIDRNKTMKLYYDPEVENNVKWSTVHGLEFTLSASSGTGSLESYK